MRMVITRNIEAPLEKVFRTVSEIGEFQKALPHIVKVEMLSEVKSGVGTRFRETRMMKGREQNTVLEVTEFVPNDQVRLISDAGGSRWDTVFTVKAANGGTVLTMVMEATPHHVFARLMNCLIGKMVKKEVEKDMDAVKEFCERK